MNWKLLTCAILGHSHIHDFCMGYHSCARCSEQLGDSLAGCYKDRLVVGTNCDCWPCVQNYNKISWKHKLFVKYPFSEKRLHRWGEKKVTDRYEQMKKDYREEMDTLLAKMESRNKKLRNDLVSHNN